MNEIMQAIVLMILVVVAFLLSMEVRDWIRFSRLRRNGFAMTVYITGREEDMEREMDRVARAYWLRATQEGTRQ